MTEYLPEGFLFGTAENDSCLSSFAALSECKESRRIIEAPCIICDSRHDLVIDLGCMKGIIPREEGAIGIADGTTKDIALISRVNKPVCFVVKDFKCGERGGMCAVLSRREAQTMCSERYIKTLSAGDVIPARVTHLEQFGCFVDIGCGIPSLIPIDLISVSRISHPSDRFYVGQDIRAVVKSFDGGRVCLSHKELLGTWEENAAAFEQGETVTGIVRSVEDYGVFIELAPNLAGLAEPRGNIAVNQHASVYIKAIIPEKMKIKLIIVNAFDSAYQGNELNYFITSGHIDRWTYSCPSSAKLIETVFSE
ncbi:MAG: S1 RNA-binding domain-containing protein [Lachnospiraceae bacterium]|nr:S1 RNA-binding domain-containing protein [Ruminococcus sp.]MCM1274086.1 S1 RNA-binding domain-containing protein [Lachnospiraceae bacterium]